MGVSGVLVSAAGFFLLPVYTRFLSPADYGTFDILDTTVKILLMFLMMGITSGMFRSFYGSGVARNTVVSTTFNFSFTYQLIIVLALIPFLGPISKFFLEQEDWQLLFWILAAMFFANMSDITMRLYRLREQAMGSMKTVLPLPMAREWAHRDNRFSQFYHALYTI